MLTRFIMSSYYNIKRVKKNENECENMRLAQRIKKQQVSFLSSSPASRGIILTRFHLVYLDTQ